MAERSLAAHDPQRDPHETAAERAVLGAVLMGEAWGEPVLPLVAAILRAEDFYHPAHAAIFGCFATIAARGGAGGERLDAVSACAELRAAGRLNAVGGMAYVASLVDEVPGPSSAETHARIVADCAQRRRVIRAAGEAIERARRGGTTWAGDVNKRLSTALDTRADSAPLLSLRDRAGHVAERMATRRSAGTSERGLSTGLSALDRMTPGGLLPGQLIVIAGRPGLGKTSLFLQLALHAAASGKGSVLLFSLEMDVDELVERALCARALVDSARAADGVLSERDANAILEAIPQLERLPVLFDPRSRLRMADVRARVLAARTRGPLAFVGLDYLQLLEEDGGAESREEAISRATRECKLLANEAGVPFVLLSQFNRANEKDKRAPRISDLRGSGAIEQDADKVWMIHSEAGDEEPEPEVAIIVGKQRKGPKGPVRVRFVRSLTVFRDVESDAADEWTNEGSEGA